MRKFIEKINSIFSIFAVIVLILCAAYLIRGIFVHHRSNQIATELKNLKPGVTSTAASDADSQTISFEESDESSSGSIFRLDVACAEETLLVEEDLIPVELDDDSFAYTKEDAPVLQEQFYELFERNNDLVGWIYVNSDIDYPIVWLDEDNDFYMNHDYDKNVSDDGWIFLDKRNASDMNDDQLLIYGHNMRAGTMFGELDRYRQLDYVSAHPIIELQSIYDAEPRKYVIISLFDASMNKDHNTYIKITNFNFETPEDKQDYIDAVLSRSLFELPCSATYADQLVTLVTCSYSHPNGRFLVVARQLHDDETADHITSMYSELK